MKHELVPAPSRSDAATAFEALRGEVGLLRRALEHRQEAMTTLEGELEFLRRYFDIERVRFQDRLQIEEGALYPALHRMEQKGWLDAEWGITEKNRKAKFYHLSPAGRRQLAAQVSRWAQYTEVVGLVLGAQGA